MKRIAVELYGLTRNYESAFDSFFINFLQPLYYDGYTVDVFIHTWSKSDTDDVTWHNPTGENRGKDVQNKAIQDIIEKYRPKKIIIDKPFDIAKGIVIKEKLANNSRTYNSIISCFYSRYKVNELRKEYEKEQGLKYDWVIQTRFDISFDKPFAIDFYQKIYKQYCRIPADKNAVFTSSAPFKMCIMLDSENLECCTDLILYSSPETVNKITEFYKDLKNGNVDMPFIRENIYSLEILWKKYWKLKGLEHIKLKYIEGEDYHIVRHPSENNAFQPAPIKKYKTRINNNLKAIWLYFKPVFSWFSEIFSVIFYALKILLKSLERLKRCI